MDLRHHNENNLIHTNESLNGSLTLKITLKQFLDVKLDCGNIFCVFANFRGVEVALPGDAPAADRAETTCAKLDLSIARPGGPVLT
jgi:hypothetical protein